MEMGEHSRFVAMGVNSHSPQDVLLPPNTLAETFRFDAGEGGCRHPTHRNVWNTKDFLKFLLKKPSKRKEKAGT